VKGIALFLASAIAGSAAGGSPEPGASAFNHFYNLEYEVATQEFRDFTVSHPQSIEGWNYLGQAIFYSALFDCGMMGSDLMMSNDSLLHAPKVVLTPEHDAELQSAMKEAQDLAEARLKANPQDTEALYELGVTDGLRANYEMLAKHAWMAGFKAANESRKLHEKVLKLDPNNYDARLIPGTHQYMVGTLPLFVRLAARAAGVTGSRVEGLKMVEATAAHGEMARLDAQILLAVLYRREHRSADGIPILTQVSQTYPRNFIFRIELAKLYADTGDRGRATAAVEEINRLIAQGAPGYCGSKLAVIRRNETEVQAQIAQLPGTPDASGQPGIGTVAALGFQSASGRSPR
jgi:hypothetical protein